MISLRVGAVDGAAYGATVGASLRHSHGRLGSVQRSLLLRLAYILLVPDPLIAKPVAHLAHTDTALACQLFLGLLRRIRVGQVRVEIGVQDLLGLFAKISPLASRVQESRTQDHDRLACALLQLHLYGAELASYDLHHAIDLSGGDGPRLGLVLEQVNGVRGELVAGALILVKLAVVDLADLRKLLPIVRVLEGHGVGGCRRVGRRV